MKRIALVTDAWHPQINGVVTTLGHTVKNLQHLGFRVETFSPSRFRSIPCPSYPEIRLALAGRRQLAKPLLAFAPHAVHIATEGPLGWAARAVCGDYRFPFTSSYHTRFPEYLRLRWPIPLHFSYRLLRRFHRSATRTMVATTALQNELGRRGFGETVLWSRGVDTTLFKPTAKGLPDEPRPILISVGRVAVEKNIEAFLQLDLPGTKYVVGDGPARAELSRAYPDVRFTGYRTGPDLAALIAAADLFVFPSRTDTFGVVMLEAMAAGVPIAAYPVDGPLASVVNGVNGWLDEDLRHAALQALQVSPESCRQYALRHSWEVCSRQFLGNLALQESPLGPDWRPLAVTVS